MNDERLLELLRGDPNAGMEYLIDRYMGYVMALVRARLGNVCDSAEIEDCAVDVFIRFQRGVHSFEPKGSVKNYLCVIARNTAYDYFKKKAPVYSFDDEDFSIEIPDGSDVEREIEMKELTERVFDEIKKMGDPDSAILFRKYYLGENSKKIAEDLKLTVSNVDTRAHRAIAKLRKIFCGE